MPFSQKAAFLGTSLFASFTHDQPLIPHPPFAFRVIRVFRGKLIPARQPQRVMGDGAIRVHPG